jgi:hypothetical protein
VLSYPFAWLPAVIVLGVPAITLVPLFAFVGLVVFLVVAFVAVVASGWGLVATSRAVGRQLWWR